MLGLLDEYANSHKLKIGEPTPTGILYAEAKRRYVISVARMGSLGTEVAMFPRSPGSVGPEASAFEAFVLSTVSARFVVLRCDAIQGYKASTLYGYDAIAI